MDVLTQPLVDPLSQAGCSSTDIRTKTRIYPTTFKATHLFATVSILLQLNPIYHRQYTPMHPLQLVPTKRTLGRTGYLCLLSAQVLDIIAHIQEQVLCQVHLPLPYLLLYQDHSHPTSLIPTPIMGFRHSVRQIQIITNS